MERWVGGRVVRTRRCWVGGVAAMSVVALAGCGSAGPAASGPQGGDGLPDTVRLMVSAPLTGPAAFAGTEAEKGYELAVEEINESGFLGEGVTLEIDVKDTQASVQKAASDFTAAVSDPEVSAVLGSLSSGEAVAQSPIAENQKMPTVYIQAGSPGVVLGDYTYRFPTPMSEYYDVLSTYVEEEGWDSVGVVYAPWIPTLKDVGEVALPAMAEELGMEVTASVATQQTTQDFSAPIEQVLASDPDVVSILQIGPANATAMQQLRQAGYDGPVLGNSSAGAGTLAPAGAAGAGMVWPVDFAPGADDPAVQEFVELYREANDGEDPYPYAAEAYDAVWFVARALKEADSAGREELKDAMATIAAEPWTGALGTDHTFEDNSLVVGGVAVEWDGSQENVLYSAER
ncbi:branched-chain amino acid transport system substrate-binding protein [Nocardioides zeae]|uniref:Branched-chain amino acid transport system substrate-binding protein n=2 Tax=Nocardioides zeae TaxID=1457234 RepID=A0AAJ1U121_9ACTN|nr:branched-chain amino acid transport system substrate-binding protein [Nocardioides zeae]